MTRLPSPHVGLRFANPTYGRERQGAVSLQSPGEKNKLDPGSQHRAGMGRGLCPMSTTTHTQESEIRLAVPQALHGKRLDTALAVLLPDHSRSRLQRFVREGYVRVDGRVPECSDKVPAGALVELDLPEPAEVSWKAQPIPLEVIHEDAALLVINKPPGMVVHPGAGNPEGTLLNAVMHHAPGIEAVPRAGIVHRLDKDTSGLLVVAKTDAVRLRLVRELQARRIKREYLALVRGVSSEPPAPSPRLSGGTRSIELTCPCNNAARKRRATTA